MNIQEINTLPPEDMKAELKKAALSGEVGLEVRHRRADGSIRDVEVFSNKIETAGRDYLYLIIHDITERKWAERILMESHSLSIAKNHFLPMDSAKKLLTKFTSTCPSLIKCAG